MSDERRSIPVWGAVGLLLGAFAVAVLAMLGVAALNEVAHGLTFREALARSMREPFNLACAQALGLAVAIYSGRYIFDRSRPMRALLSLEPPPVAVVALALCAGVGLQFPLAELSNALQVWFPIPLEQQIQVQHLVSPDTVREALVAIVAVVVVPAASEELFFRGLLLPGLARRHGSLFALTLTAMLFGSSHFAPAAIGYATVAGLVLGWVALRTRSTWTSIAMHGAVNAVPLLLPERVVRIPGFNVVSEDVYHVPLLLVIGGTVVAVAAIAVIVRISGSEDDQRR